MKKIIFAYSRGFKVVQNRTRIEFYNAITLYKNGGCGCRERERVDDVDLQA
jgi:predicted transcriptional regulator